MADSQLVGDGPPPAKRPKVGSPSLTNNDNPGKVSHAFWNVKYGLLRQNLAVLMQNILQSANCQHKTLRIWDFQLCEELAAYDCGVIASPFRKFCLCPRQSQKNVQSNPKRIKIQRCIAATNIDLLYIYSWRFSGRQLTCQIQLCVDPLFWSKNNLDLELISSLELVRKPDFVWK